MQSISCQDHKSYLIPRLPRHKWRGEDIYPRPIIEKVMENGNHCQHCRIGYHIGPKNYKS